MISGALPSGDVVPSPPLGEVTGGLLLLLLSGGLVPGGGGVAQDLADPDIVEQDAEIRALLGQGDEEAQPVNRAGFKVGRCSPLSPVCIRSGGFSQVVGDEVDVAPSAEVAGHLIGILQ